MNNSRHLVLGGVKSGKSRYAMQLASEHAANHSSHGHNGVIFIATARADDDEMRLRIERHKEERPSHWRIIEEPRNLTERLQSLDEELKYDKTPSIVLIDCLTLWLTQLCCEELTAGELSKECECLVHQVESVNYPIILVSNELNMGVTPLGEFSRQYCDAAGILHQNLASVCNSVTLVVAGLPLTLKPN